MPERRRRLSRRRRAKRHIVVFVERNVGSLFFANGILVVLMDLCTFAALANTASRGRSAVNGQPLIWAVQGG